MPFKKKLQFYKNGNHSIKELMYLIDNWYVFILLS